MDLIDEELTYKVRGSVFEVSKQLGAGFLEKIYERALMIELGSSGLECRNQCLVSVIYKGNNIGEYFVDIIVENKIILELKAQENIRSEHKA